MDKDKIKELKQKGLIPENDEDFDIDDYIEKLSEFEAEGEEEGEVVDVIFGEEEEEGTEEEEVSDSEGEDEEGAGEKTDEDPSAEKSERLEKRNKDRGSRRIKSLLERNKTLEKEIQELQSRAQSMESQPDLLIQNADSQIEAIEAKIALARNSLKEAREQGEDTVDIEDKIVDYRIDLKVAQGNKEALKAKAAQGGDRQPEARRQVNTDPYETKVQEVTDSFVRDNPWLAEPQTKDERRLKAEALKIARVYENELRYDMADPDTYADIKDELIEFAKEKGLSVDGFYTPEKTRRQKQSPAESTKRSTTNRSKKIVVSKEEQDFLENVLGFKTKEQQIAWVKARNAREKQKTSGWRNL